MSTKFEQLLDYLVNEEMDKANELFHEIVVEKSREIYENLISEEEEEEQQDEAREEEDESVEEAKDEEDEEQQDESMDLEDSYEVEGGDATDDLEQDVSMPDMGDEEPGMGDEEPGMGEPSEDEAMMDIKNAIEELEAAFAELEAAQGGEMGGDEFGGDEFGADEPADAEFGADDDEGEETDEMMGRPGMFENKKRITREYRETVKKPSGDIAGANTGEKMPSGSNTKSAINTKAAASAPKTGAHAGNILGKSSTAAEDGTKPHGKVGGLVKSGGEFTKGVEKNISSSASSSMKSGSDLAKQGSGYPSNNKSAGPVGSGTGDKAGQTSVSNDKSLLKHIK